MASVDGSRSYLAGSDEVLQHACGPCKDDGETKEANYFCEFCNVGLCFDCRNDHKTFKATKNHSVVSMGTNSAASKETFAILCGCDQKRAVDIYCEKHEEVICPSCEKIKHRNCKTCQIKDKVTKDTKKILKELMDYAKSLKAGIESCKQDGEANHKKLDENKDECKKEITAFRREINKILDNFEEDIIENLDTIAKQQLQALEKHNAALAAALQALDMDLESIENATKTNKDKIMFSANIKISKSLSEYDDLIQEIRNGMQLPNLKFHKNKKLTDLLKSFELQGLGRIEVSEAGSAQQANVMLLDMKVKSKQEVDITLSDDRGYPDIHGCTFLSNGRILLCDYNNKNLKLLDIDMSVKESLKLLEYPLKVAVIDENEAIFTLHDCTYLQYIYTNPDLKLGRKVTLPGKCHGIQVFNGEIYTTYHKASGRDEIWRLDRAGNIMSSIVLTQRSSKYSDCLGLCLKGSNPRVYLTDSYASRLTCFQLDSKMVYQYRIPEQLAAPDGIYVDSVGNSLVCGRNSNNVVIITADGRKHGELLTGKDITRPRCIDYRPEDNTLIVGCDAISKLFVYKLEM